MELLRFILLLAFVLVMVNWIMTPQVDDIPTAVKEYQEAIVVNKDDAWFLMPNKIRAIKDNATYSFYCSDLVYQTWNIGDTIKTKEPKCLLDSLKKSQNDSSAQNTNISSKAQN